MAVCVPSNVEITHNKIRVAIATEKIRRDKKKGGKHLAEEKREKEETDRYTGSRRRGRASATQTESEREREGGREYQLFSEGNVKLPWIRQTAGSSPEKRENELE